MQSSIRGLSALITYCERNAIRVEASSDAEVHYRGTKGLNVGTLYIPMISFRDLLRRGPEQTIRSIAADICHELGHYVITPESRRWMKDYGIGERRTDFFDTEEQKAAAVGSLFMRKFGFRSNSKRVHNLKAKSWWIKSRTLIEQRINETSSLQAVIYAIHPEE